MVQGLSQLWFRQILSLLIIYLLPNVAITMHSTHAHLDDLHRVQSSGSSFLSGTFVVSRKGAGEYLESEINTLQQPLYYF